MFFTSISIKFNSQKLLEREISARFVYKYYVGMFKVLLKRQFLQKSVRTPLETIQRRTIHASCAIFTSSQDGLYRRFAEFKLYIFFKSHELFLGEIKNESIEYRKQKTFKNITREGLEGFTKEELISLLLKLNAHNKQLKAFIKNEVPPEFALKEDSHRFDISKCRQRRILLKLCYLGWSYDGFVLQDTKVKTIEFFLFDALLRTGLIADRKSSNYHQGSRTDKKVSAFESVVSLDVRSRVAPDDQLTKAGIEEEIDYCSLLNKLFPLSLRAISWRPVSSQRYSARFDCVDRTYKYYFPRGDLNIERMKEACNYLIGTHDFRNLCKMDVATGIVHYNRKVFSAEVKLAQRNQESIGAFDMLYFEIKASSFLYNMIRCIMSILMIIGQEREPPSLIKELLDVEKNNRKPQYSFAHEIPLCLFKCNFQEEIPDTNDDRTEMLNQWIINEAGLRRAISNFQQQWSFENTKSTMIYEILKALQDEYSSRFPNEPAINDQVRALAKDRQNKKIMDRATSQTLEEKINHFTEIGKIAKYEIVKQNEQ